MIIDKDNNSNNNDINEKESSLNAVEKLIFECKDIQSNADEIIENIMIDDESQLNEIFNTVINQYNTTLEILKNIFLKTRRYESIKRFDKVLLTLSQCVLYRWKEDQQQQQQLDNGNSKIIPIDKEIIGEGPLYLYNVSPYLNILDVYLDSNGNNSSGDSEYVRFPIISNSPVLSYSRGHYILQQLDGDYFYGLLFPQDIPNVYLDIFEKEISRIAYFGYIPKATTTTTTTEVDIIIKDDKTKTTTAIIEKREEEQGFVINILEKASTGLDSGSQSIANSILSASAMISLSLRGGGFYLKSNIDQHESETQVSPFVSKSIGYVKKATPYAVKGSAFIIDSITDIVGEVGNGIITGVKMLLPEDDPNEPKEENETLNAAASFGKTSLKAVKSITSALSEGFSQIVDEASGTTVDLVHHAYGSQVARITDDSFSISKDIVTTAITLPLGANKVAFKIATKGVEKTFSSQSNNINNNAPNQEKEQLLLTDIEIKNNNHSQVEMDIAETPSLLMDVNESNLQESSNVGTTQWNTTVNGEKILFTNRIAPNTESQRQHCFGFCDLYLFCFSIDSRSSFESIDLKYFKEMKINETKKKIPIILVGMKADLRNNSSNDQNQLVSNEEALLQLKKIKGQCYIEMAKLNKSLVLFAILLAFVCTLICVAKAQHKINIEDVESLHIDYDEDEFEGMPIEKKYENLINNDDVVVDNSNEETEQQQQQTTTTDDSKSTEESKKESTTETKQAQQPKKKNNWVLEISFVAFIIGYGVNYFVGTKTNRNLVQVWGRKFYNLLDKNFSMVGSNGNFNIVRTSVSSFSLICTGRVNCHGAQITLDLKKRHDLFNVLLDLVGYASPDRITIEVAMNQESMDTFILGVTKTKALKTFKSERNDVSLFCSKLNLPQLSQAYTVLGDTDGLQSLFLKSEVIQLLNDSEPYFESIPKALQFVYKIPKITDLDKIYGLTKMSFYYIDLIASTALPKPQKAKAEKLREKARAEIMKQAHAERQEEAQKKKYEKLQKEKEDAAKLSPESQRKRDEKEYKKSLKKRAGKNKVILG
eukprot:gene2072-2558_t